MQVSTRAAAALLLLAGAATAAADPACADTFTFDRDHTSIIFSWDHVGLSRQSGRVLDYDGTLEFDPEQPEAARLDVTMRVQSLWTGVPALDRQLRSSDFFDAQAYPVIGFKSTDIRRTSDKTGEVTGNLTIMGQSRPVTLQVVWNFAGPHPFAAVNPSYGDKTVAGFSATARLNRSNWGLDRGVPLISDEIRIVIETELLKK